MDIRQLAPPHQERLLETAAGDVSPAVRNAAREFCEGRPGVVEAWVCAVEWIEPGREPERRLRFAVRLNSPIGQPDAGFAATRRLMAGLTGPQADLVAEAVWGFSRIEPLQRGRPGPSGYSPALLPEALPIRGTGSRERAEVARLRRAHPALLLEHVELESSTSKFPADGWSRAQHGPAR
jgi:hypothetical protein